MSEYSKIRLKSYFRTFVYMSICGLLFVIGGGAFFIYESVAMVRSKPPGHEEDMYSSSGYVSHSKAAYASEFRIVGFIFIGVGTLMLCIGLPLAYQFWKRYQVAKDVERCPMLDPNYSEKLRKAYSISPQGRPGLKRQRTREKDQKHQRKESTSLVGRCNEKFWSFGRTKNVTKDSFRFAAHHHPSFNLVPIEGLAALSRDEMEAFSRFRDIESDEEVDEAQSQSTSRHSSLASSNTKKTKKAQSFLKRFFGIADDVDNDVMPTNGIENLAAEEVESPHDTDHEEATTSAEVTVTPPNDNASSTH